MFLFETAAFWLVYSSACLLVSEAAFLVPVQTRSLLLWSDRPSFVLLQDHNVPRRYRGFSHRNSRRRLSFFFFLFATVSPPSKSESSSPSPKNNNNGGGSVDARRKELFGRKGTHFLLDRRTGRIEFGDTVPLLSKEFQFPNNDIAAINDSDNNDNNTNTLPPCWQLLDAWLSDVDEFGAAMWMPDKLTFQGDHTYRLGLSPLEFVMLQFQPWVDVQVKTVRDRQGLPVFTMQSVGCDPNPTHITFVPGMPTSLTLEDVVKNLQITVEVVGQIRRSPRPTNTTTGGGSLKGTLVFQVSGTLPPALLLFPDPLLKAAAETINAEVVKFAKKAFLQGTTPKFQEFLLKQKK